MIVYALVTEPMRYLNDEFLRHASQASRPDQSRLLLDLATPKFSPVLAVMQYLHALLSGQVDRTVLLFRRVGCDALSQFVLRCPKVARVLTMLQKINA